MPIWRPGRARGDSKDDSARFAVGSRRSHCPFLIRGIPCHRQSALSLISSISGKRLTQARWARKSTGETPLAVRMRSDSVYKFRPGGILINFLPNSRASNVLFSTFPCPGCFGKFFEPHRLVHFQTAVFLALAVERLHRDLCFLAGLWGGFSVRDADFNLSQHRHHLLWRVPLDGYNLLFLKVNSLSFHLVQISPVRSNFYSLFHSPSGM